MKKRGTVLGLAAAAVLILGTIVGVSAQTEDDSAPGGNFIAKLAANLGIGEDSLKAAVEQTQNEVIDEGVAAGRLTEKRAEQMRQRVAEGGGMKFGFRGHCFGHGDRDEGDATDATAAPPA